MFQSVPEVSLESVNAGSMLWFLKYLVSNIFSEVSVIHPTVFGSPIACLMPVPGCSGGILPWKGNKGLRVLCFDFRSIVLECLWSVFG